MQARKWLFTVSKADDEGKYVKKKNKKWRKMGEIYPNIQYVCWGVETAPTTGTLHLQGYLILKKKGTMAQIKKGMNCKSMHLKIARGTTEQNVTYCKKDGDFYEWGEDDKPGERTDLIDVRQDAKLGMRAILNASKDNGAPKYNYQACRMAELYLKYEEPKRDWVPEVYWIWGPSGSGKTKLAIEITEGMNTFKKGPRTGKWFDGYDGHEALIIDELRDEWMSLPALLELIDRYECRVETKGGSRQILAKVIVITTIKHPKKCYSFSKEEPEKQLARRITKVIEMKAHESDDEDVDWESKEIANEVAGGRGVTLAEAPPEKK